MHVPFKELTTDFVGRESELQQFAQFVNEVAAGKSQCLMIRAPSGGGKSYFLSRALEGVKDRGFQIVSGQGIQLSALAPGYMLSSLSELIGKNSHRPEVKKYYLDFYEELTKVFPDLSRLASHMHNELQPFFAEETSTEQDPFAAIRTATAVVKLINLLATEKKPLLILLDDFQWADHLTFSIIKTWLLEKNLSKYVGIVFLCRSENADLVDQFFKNTEMQKISFDNLSVHEVHEYLENHLQNVTKPLSESVFRLSGGHPIYLKLILQKMQTSAVTRFDSFSLNDVILPAVHEFPEDLKDFLYHAAIVGKRGSVLTIKNILGQDVSLEPLIRSGLFFMSDHAKYEFAHDKIRESIIDFLSEAKRKKIHHQIASYAEVHAMDEFSPYAMAFHFNMAGDAEKAVHYAALAAEDAARSCAFDLAIKNYNIVIENLTDQQTAVKRKYFELRGDVCLLSADYVQAEQSFTRAYELLQTEESQILDKARILGKMGEVEFKTGRVAQSRDLVEKALAQLDVTIPRTKILLFSLLTIEFFKQFWHTINYKKIRETQKVASEQDVLVLRLLSRLAYCYWFSKGAVPCAWAHLKEMNMAEQYVDSLELAQAYSEHAPVSTMAPMYNRGREYVLRSQAIRKKLGSAWGIGQSKSFLGAVEYADGKFEKSIQQCLEAYEILNKRGDRWEANTSGWHLALAHYRLGQMKLAYAFAERTYLDSKKIGDYQIAAIGLGVQAKASDGRGIRLRDIEEVQKFNLEDLHARAELITAHALYLKTQKRYIEAEEVMEKIVQAVETRGLRQEYVAPIWVWMCHFIRLSLENENLSVPERLLKQKKLKKYLFKAYHRSIFYRNNLPQYFREKALYYKHFGKTAKAIDFLKKSMKVADDQGALFERMLSEKEMHAMVSPHLIDLVQGQLDQLSYVYQEEKTERDQLFVKTMQQMDRLRKNVQSKHDGLEILDQFMSSTFPNLTYFVLEKNVAQNSFKTLRQYESWDESILTALNSQKATSGDWIINDSIYQVFFLGMGYGCVVVSLQGYEEDIDHEMLKQFIGNICFTFSIVIESVENDSRLSLIREELEARIKIATHEARAASQAKSDFLANMSHEIRTPLNGVVGTINFLKDTKLDKEQQQFVDALKLSSETLLSLVNDILDMSRIESGQLSLDEENFDLHQFVERVTSVFSAQAKAKKIRLIPEVRVSNSLVRSDMGKVRQILSNFISNSIKFTDEGEVKIFVHEKEDGVYCFEVHDTGSGIADADKEKLFRSFSQVDSSAKKRFGGSGLGLAISKKLVEFLHGRFGFSSEVGKGSVFWFDVKLNVVKEDVPSLTSVTNSMPNLPVQKLKILVAEDNQVNQMIIRTMLEKLGHEVTLVANGIEFIREIEIHNFDLAFLDCQMPDMDGFEACRKIRERQLKSPPIVALTAYALKADQERCFSAGMDDFLGKPVKVEDVQEKIARWIH